MDYLFSVIMALVLLCSQNFIDIPILSYFGSITLLIFTFVLFVDLFPERYKNLIQTMSVFAIVSDFAQKDRLNTFCRKIENKFKIK